VPTELALQSLSLLDYGLQALFPNRLTLLFTRDSGFPPIIAFFDHVKVLIQHALHGPKRFFEGTIQFYGARDDSGGLRKVGQKLGREFKLSCCGVAM
jgi:hypothetical protein